VARTGSEGGAGAAPARPARPGSRTGRLLWLGFGAALVALAVMLVLQYRWLSELQRSSVVARRASLQKMLDVVDKEVYGFWVASAERVLNPPAWLFDEGRLETLAKWFQKNRPDGAARLFAISYRGPDWILFLDPGSNAMKVSEHSPESLAVWTATAPFAVMAKRGAAIRKPDLLVDERDRAFRIILKPVTDENARVVGVVGMIVDPHWLGHEALPKAIQGTLHNFPKSESLAVTVLDGAGKPVVGAGVAADLKRGVSRRLSFVFTDWRLVVSDRRTTPELLARRNFLINVGFSVGLAGALLAAILLVLRVASREVKLSAMKSDFVSNVSHELRTPLASIRVFGEFLRLGRVTEPDKVREYGEYIETESRRLTRLVNNILDFSRIESGRKAYSFREADLGEVVRSAVDTFAVRVRGAGFTIGLQLPVEPLPPIRVDADAIDQAVCNLLDNAVKYSGDSRVVEVSVAPRDGAVAVAVADRGIGIPRDEQQRIFERFHRVGTGLVHEVRGAGLGLAIVRHVVRAHGGRVEVESEAGRGSTFTIVLPVSGPPTAPAGGNDAAGQNHGGGAT
jgi:signal transduction histidine kinase